MGSLNTRGIMGWVLASGCLISLETCLSLCFVWLSICSHCHPRNHYDNKQLGRVAWKKWLSSWIGLNKYAKNGFQQNCWKEEGRMREGCNFYPVPFRCSLDP